MVGFIDQCREKLAGLVMTTKWCGLSGPKCDEIMPSLSQRGRAQRRQDPALSRIFCKEMLMYFHLGGEAMIDSSRQTSGVNPRQICIFRLLPKKHFAMEIAGTRFVAGKKSCPDLNSVGTKRKCRNNPTPICNPAGRDDRDLHFIDNLRNQRKGTDQ